MIQDRWPALSIIIVNWNTRELLEQCLSTIIPSIGDCEAEIIVVDNASDDNSVGMVRREFPGVRWITNQANLGFAQANNQALKIAKGRYVLLLNPDTVVLGRALSEMASHLDVHPHVGAVGCKLLNSDGSVQRSCWNGFPSLKFALIDALYLWKIAPQWKFVQSSEISVGNLQDPIEVDHLLGACLMVRRDVVGEIGGLDPGYFLFLEETDWCYRIQQAGYRIHYLPTAEVIHYGEQSVRKNPERSVPELYRSYCRFCRKTYQFGLIGMTLLKLIIGLAALIRVGLWSGRLLGGQQRLALCMIRGYACVLARLASF